MKPELIFYNGVALTEAVQFDKQADCLYFAAIRDEMVFSLHIGSGAVRTYTTDGPVGGVLVDGKGGLIFAEKTGIYAVCPLTGEKTRMIQIIDSQRRYNHLLMDQKGRILVGVLGDFVRFEETCGLYVIDGECVTYLIQNVKTPNGMDFSKNGKLLYFVDTAKGQVLEYPYDQQTGQIGKGHLLMSFPGKERPDGLCVDDSGAIWVTEWDGGKIGRYHPKDGRKIGEVLFPCGRVTSCCIAGSWLYAATAKCEQFPDAPAGGIFRVKM